MRLVAASAPRGFVDPALYGPPGAPGPGLYELVHLVCSSCSTGARVDPLYGTRLMCHLRAVEEGSARERDDDPASSD